MKNKMRAFSEYRSERGQAMILFAVIAATMLGVLGIAIEGGRVFVEYRRMQAAADMAALVGAQSLPCTSGDTTCTHAANQAYWCAMSNYYGAGNVPGNSGVDCTTTTAQSSVSGAVTAAVDIPPTACSPYDSMDYGNNSTDASCKQTTISNTSNDFVEVRMDQSVTVPIFNTTFTLHAHAVARHGEPSPKDFAITMLDPSGNDISLSGAKSHGLVVLGSVVSDSTSPNSNSGSITNNSVAQITCDGGWYTTANESFPGSLDSATNGSATFAPPDCTTSSGSYDSPTVWRPNWSYIADPYCTSIAPPITPSGVTDSSDENCRGAAPSTASTIANCVSCQTYGWAYEWGTTRSAGKWYEGNSAITMSGSQNWEFFPGIYSKIQDSAKGTGTSAYFNPGIYTMTGDLKIQAQTSICIYGAPACSAGNQITSVNSKVTCSTADFSGSSTNLVNSASWYYYCSPWGLWDSKLSRTGAGNASAPAPTTAAPTFTDNSTPLNGVTFYLVNHANLDMEGSGSMQLAFPNPCPGTATEGTNQVPFFDPANPGVAAGTSSSNTGYTYPSTSLANQDGFSNSKNYSVYPSPDITLEGECKSTNAGNEWTQEFGQLGGQDETQHLHFLVFSRDGQSSIKIAGSANQNIWGIIYNPGDPTAYGTSGCATPTKCSITLTGGGGGSDGPPMMVGQIVGDNMSYSGSVLTELFYRPCNPKNLCLSGAGSYLVE